MVKLVCKFKFGTINSSFINVAPEESFTYYLSIFVNKRMPNRIPGWPSTIPESKLNGQTLSVHTLPLAHFKHAALNNVYENKKECRI